MRLAPRTALLTTTLCLGAAWAPAAHGGTIAQSTIGDFTAITYTAAPGEVNAVTITNQGDGVTVTDTGIAIADGDGVGGCGVAGGVATCPGGTGLTPIDDLTVSLADADDALSQNALILADSGQLLGGTGDDTITGSAGDDTIDGGAGNDTLDGGAGDDDVSGDDDEDAVAGGTGDDEVAGGEGDDTVDGGAGSDVADGDTGNDAVSGAAGGDEVVGGPGSDTVSGGDGADGIGGGPGDDVLDGGADDDYVRAGAGDDPGADTITGGTGTDEVDYGSAFVPVVVTADGVAGDGHPAENDNVATDVEVLDGGGADDALTGGPGPSVLFGGGGNDALDGAGGEDTLSGGTGRDTLTGGEGKDRLRGDAGPDTLDGGEGDDVLSGSAGGTDGDADVLEGAGGSDTADFSGSGLPLVVTLDGAANDGPVAEGDNVLTENVLTGFGDDTVVGTAGRNVISTGSGNDVINVSGDGQETDDVDCGAGFDEATVDGRDAVATTGEQSRCETVNGIPASDSPAAIRRPVTIRDRQAARISVSLSGCPRRLRSFRRGCRVRVVGNEAIRVQARITASFKRVRVSAGSGLVLAERGTAFSGVDGVRRVSLKPTRRLLRKVPRRFRVRVLIEAFDRGGNRTATTRTATIRR